MSPSCRFMRKQPCGNIPINQKEDDFHIERKMFDALSIKGNSGEQQRIDPYGEFPNNQSSFQNNHFPSHHIHSQRKTSATNFARTFAPTEPNRIPHNGYHHHQPQQQPYHHHQQPQQQHQDLRKTSTPNYSDMSRRLETFFTWPKTAYLQPFGLAEAGFVYSGTGDAVKCYKCGVSLRNWEPNDTAWAEHEKWSPVCPLVVQRIQNVNNNIESRAQLMQETSNLSLDETYLRRYQQQHQQQQYERPHYETARSLPTGFSQYETRASPQAQQQPSTNTTNNYHAQKPVQQNASNLPSFQKPSTMVGYPIPQAPSFQKPSTMVGYPRSQTPSQQYYQKQPSEQTQHNNSYYTQRNHDYGFHTKSELKESYATPNYEPPRTPQKNGDFTSTDSQEESFIKEGRKTVTSSDAQRLVGMGFDVKMIQQTIDCYTSYASRSFSSLDDLAQAVLYFQEHGNLEGTPFGKDLNVNPSKEGEQMIYERATNSKPLSAKEAETDRQGCKICMDNDVQVTFVPCGHLVVCESCALGMKLCPICRLEVQETVRTYFFAN